MLEVAARLGISDDAALRACQRGAIRNITLGKRRLIPASYLAELEAEARAHLRARVQVAEAETFASRDAGVSSDVPELVAPLEADPDSIVGAITTKPTS